MAHVVEHAHSDGNLFYVFIGISIWYFISLFVENILLPRSLCFLNYKPEMGTQVLIMKLEWVLKY